jgi:hypothetical protein
MDWLLKIECNKMKDHHLPLLFMLEQGAWFCTKLTALELRKFMRSSVGRDPNWLRMLVAKVAPYYLSAT